MKTVSRYLTFFLLAALVILGTKALAQQTVNQGAPGTQGPWPVTPVTGTFSDGGPRPTAVTILGSFAGTYGEEMLAGLPDGGIGGAATVVPTYTDGGTAGLATRSSVTVQNLGANDLFCGHDNTVTPSTGLKIGAAGGSAVFPVSASVKIWCSGSTDAGSDIRWEEL